MPLAWVPGLGDGPALRGPRQRGRHWPPRPCSTSWCAGRRATARWPGVPSGSSACCPPPSCSSWATPRRSCSSSPSGASSPCGRRPARPASPRPHFAVAGALAFAAALTRPIGVLLVVAVAAELVRWWPRLAPCGAAGGLGRGGGALRRAARLPGLVQAHGRGLARPRCGCSSRARTTGALSDPFTTLYHDAAGVLHHHVGTALHVPVGAAGPGPARGLLAPAPGSLHAVRRRGPGRRGGRVQPRFLRALRPECLPVVDRGRRSFCRESPARAGRPRAAAGRRWPATRSWPSSTSRSPDRSPAST